MKKFKNSRLLTDSRKLQTLALNYFLHNRSNSLCYLRVVCENYFCNKEFEVNKVVVVVVIFIYS